MSGRSAARLLGRRAAGLSSQDRAATRMLASLLLDYPSEDNLARVPQWAQVAGALPDAVRKPLSDVLAWLAGTPHGDVAAEYVRTFDHTRRCCLFLTYYAYGDTRRRGMALLETKHAFRDAGWVLRDDELPDHLAVVLEFAATEPAAGERLLLDLRAGVELLRLALAERGSPYAGVLVAVCATLPPLGRDEAAAVDRLVAQGPPTEEVGLAPYGPPSTRPVPLTLTTRTGAVR